MLVSASKTFKSFEALAPESLIGFEGDKSYNTSPSIFKFLNPSTCFDISLPDSTFFPNLPKKLTKSCAVLILSPSKTVFPDLILLLLSIDTNLFLIPTSKFEPSPSTNNLL